MIYHSISQDRVPSPHELRTQPAKTSSTLTQSHLIMQQHLEHFRTIRVGTLIFQGFQKKAQSDQSGIWKSVKISEVAAIELLQGHLASTSRVSPTAIPSRLASTSKFRILCR